jgi:carbon monoxide dehydrogenase subunit G
MAHVEESTTIAAPVEEIFGLIADHSRARSWLEGFERFEHLSGPDRGVGARVRAEGRFLGLTVETELEIVEYDPPRRLVSVSTKGVRSHTSWILQPSETGTLVSFVGDYSLPFGLRLLGDRALGQLVSDQTRRSMANLKRFFEGPTPTA